MRMSVFGASLAVATGFNGIVRASSTMMSGKVTTGPISKTATFGAGCYWGTEKYFKSDFGSKMFPGSGRVVSGQVGFMGPSSAKQNPTYEEVCSGQTHHVEVYNLEFEGDEKTYEDLVKHFFMFHDPTTLNQQGNDIGTQYASAIFCADKKQMDIAQKVRDELQAQLKQGRVPSYKGGLVSTQIAQATRFYPAHEDHQAYLDKNPRGYCNHFYRLTDWPKKKLTEMR